MEQCIANSPFSNLERLQNFGLYSPRQDLTNFLIRHEVFKRVLEVQGSIVDCGVLRGDGLRAWAQFSSIFEPTNHQRLIVGFDTLRGFPKLSKLLSEFDHARPGGLAVDSYDHPTRWTELYDMNSFVGHVPKVELVAWRHDQNNPAAPAGKPSTHCQSCQSPVPLYLDFDIYEPTLAALKHFLPRMPKGAVIAFDQLIMQGLARRVHCRSRSFESARVPG